MNMYDAEAEQVHHWGRRLIIGIVLAWCVAAIAGFAAGLTLLTVAGFLLTLAGLRTAYLGCFGIGMLATLDALTRVFLLTGGLLRWNSFNYLMIIALLLAPGKAQRLSDVHTQLLLAFFLLLTLQLAFTPDLAVGLHTILNLTAPFGILLYLSRTGYSRPVLIWLAWITGVLAAAGGLVYFMQIESLPEMNMNAWSAFPLTALFSICIAYQLATPALQLKLGTLAIVNTLWVFLSGSRGGMFIALVCLTFLLIHTKRVEHRLSLFVFCPAVAAVVLTVFSGITDFALHRVTMLFDSERALESRTSGRSDLYVAGWRLFRSNPLGVGTGGFGREFAELGDRDLIFVGKDIQAHSAWTKTLVENGAIGFVLPHLSTTRLRR
jgi:MFS family permease